MVMTVSSTVVVTVWMVRHVTKRLVTVTWDVLQDILTTIAANVSENSSIIETRTGSFFLYKYNTLKWYVYGCLRYKRFQIVKYSKIHVNEFKRHICICKKNNSCVDQRHIIVYILVKVYILFDVCILKKNILY